MNYYKHYNKLIERAKYRLLETYTEKHHIIPRCMNGTNDVKNIVALTPEEHYVAHQLLVKIYPNEPKLIYSAHMMGNTRKSNKSYGWLRKRHSSILTGIPRSKEVRQQISESHKGLTQSKETKLKRSKSLKGNTNAKGINHKGEKNPMYGKQLSEEHKQKISEKLKGRILGPHSEERKQKISNTKKGKSWTSARRAAHDRKSNDQRN